MKLSIVTVTFNSAATLKDTIESVLSQTYDDYEYLIIDGASKDGTVDIIRSYEPLFKGKMRWISEKDQGIYDAMNKGIRMASGDVVGILNSDDFYYRDDVLSRVAETFNKNQDIGCTIGDLCFVDSKNTKKIVRYYSSEGWKPSLFKWGLEPPHPTFYCRKSNYEKFGYYKLDYKIGADYELMTRFLAVAKIPYVYIPMNMLCMRIGGESTKNWYNVLIVNNKEAVRACRENGVRTNLLMILCKYIFKIKGYFHLNHRLTA